LAPLLAKIYFIFDLNFKGTKLKRLSKDDIIRLNNLIQNSTKILITTHHNSDGDAIGSSLAFGLVLRKMGKSVDIITPNEYPKFLKWMTGTEMIHIYKQEEKKCRIIADEADLIMAIDFNDPIRLKNASWILSLPDKPKVLIDHHPDPVGFADLTISKTDIGSSAELIYYIFRDLGLIEYVGLDVAEALFSGIMTDTGCFSFSCSYPEVFEVVADLMKYGINKDAIYARIYDNFSENRLRLMGYCLNEKMVVLKQYNTAYISLSHDELTQFDHDPGDTEGFVNLPFSIKGILLSAIFIEKQDHVKISFRSRNNFSVNEFASVHFRGGGHLNAAGGEWDLPMEETIKRFVSLLPQYEDTLK
jgi:bifunctional oligoribonuclease and PAP phosphatase NrnA